MAIRTVSSKFQLSAIYIVSLYKLQTDHHKCSLADRGCYVPCQPFTHTRHMAWAHVLMIVTKLSCKFIQSTCNSHANNLQWWIRSIRLQCELAQSVFRVNTINSNQCTFNAYYFYRVDLP